MSASKILNNTEALLNKIGVFQDSLCTWVFDNCMRSANNNQVGSTCSKVNLKNEQYCQQLERVICCLDDMQAHENICKLNLNEMNNKISLLKEQQQFKSCEVESNQTEVMNNDKTIQKPFAIILFLLFIFGIGIFILYVWNCIADQLFNRKSKKIQQRMRLRI